MGNSGSYSYCIDNGDGGAEEIEIVSTKRRKVEVEDEDDIIIRNSIVNWEEDNVVKWERVKRVDEEEKRVCESESESEEDAKMMKELEAEIQIQIIDDTNTDTDTDRDIREKTASEGILNLKGKEEIESRLSKLTRMVKVMTIRDMEKSDDVDPHYYDHPHYMQWRIGRCAKIKYNKEMARNIDTMKETENTMEDREIM